MPFYAFPADVRWILYTTNAIEELNAKLRRTVRARGHFPTDEAAMKLVFLVLNRSEKGWKMGLREWIMAKLSSSSSSASASLGPWINPASARGNPDIPAPFSRDIERPV